MNLLEHIRKMLARKCAVCDSMIDVSHDAQLCFSCRQAVKNDLLKQIVPRAIEYLQSEPEPAIYIRGQRI